VGSSGPGSPGAPEGRPAGESGGRRGVGHGRRRAARRQAIDLLYQADVMNLRPAAVQAQWESAGRRLSPYAVDIVSGVERELESIDELLAAASEEWTVPRMASVDRTILRVACQELRSGVPPAVAINEAVEAANELSTEDSGRFVNGVLGRIARDLS